MAVSDNMSDSYQELDQLLQQLAEIQQSMNDLRNLKHDIDYRITTLRQECKHNYVFYERDWDGHRTWSTYKCTKCLNISRNAS